ncbi:RNA-binding protein 43-like [Hemitrygon akajei]|uniref:RNA-binding protein 43-like n=1 Tax=Hemitrygon akajei TaxID=2704970 RepID=UPI003BF942FA
MESDWAGWTIAVTGFPDDKFSDSVMIDKLTIHFLRPRNGGGEVENVVYPTDVPGVAYVTFEKKEVMDSVLGHDQVFEDKQLQKKYPLKIAQKSLDVFSTVSVDVDSSMFENSSEVKNVFREFENNNGNLQFSRRHDGKIRVTGSFSALKEFRKELHKTIGELQGINLQDSTMKVGIDDSEGKSGKSPHNYATWSVHQQYTASPNYGDRDTLDPGEFQEESTIILDADIFSYIDEICKKQYEQLLSVNCVNAKPVNHNNIIFLQLFETSRLKPSELKLAKYDLERFISNMQKNLVIDRIRLDRDRLKNKTLRACKIIMQNFGTVLVRFSDDCVTLIGSQDNCKQFIRKVDEMVRSDFNPAPYEYTSRLTSTESMHQFTQSMGSDSARASSVPRPMENTLPSNLDGHMTDQSGRLQRNWSVPHGKQESSSDCAGTSLSSECHRRPTVKNSSKV